MASPKADRVVPRSLQTGPEENGSARCGHKAPRCGDVIVILATALRATLRNTPSITAPSENHTRTSLLLKPFRLVLSSRTRDQRAVATLSGGDFLFFGKRKAFKGRPRQEEERGPHFAVVSFTAGFKRTHGESSPRQACHAGVGYYRVNVCITILSKIYFYFTAGNCR